VNRFPAHGCGESRKMTAGKKKVDFCARRSIGGSDTGELKSSVVGLKILVTLDDTHA
jgi:hypothetical protein